MQGLNVIPVRATGLSPYTIVFKAAPRLAVSWDVSQEAGAAEGHVDADPEDIGRCAGLWSHAFEELME